MAGGGGGGAPERDELPARGRPERQPRCHTRAPLEAERALCWVGGAGRPAAADFFWPILVWSDSGGWPGGASAARLGEGGGQNGGRHGVRSASEGVPARGPGVSPRSLGPAESFCSCSQLRGGLRRPTEGGMRRGGACGGAQKDWENLLDFVLRPVRVRDRPGAIRDPYHGRGLGEGMSNRHSRNSIESRLVHKTYLREVPGSMPGSSSPLCTVKTWIHSGD